MSTAKAISTKLAIAGAIMTACYGDREMRLIESTARQSEPVRGASVDEPWQRVAFALPPAPREAAFITLTCELRQTAPDLPSRESPRPIHLED